MKKFLLSIIAVVCCMTASADPQNVNGVYQLGSKEDLTWFANYVNTVNNTACAILTADITMNEGVLNSSGNLNSGSFEAWTPIGNDVELYFGEFNGNGHTISGLYFNDEERNNVGLFGKVGNNAYIHDVGIKDSYFYGKDHVGGICGDFASGRIENCWNGTTIKAKQWDAGGISGSCYYYASIKDCYNIGKVITIYDNDSYGGICGAVYENTSVDYTISNCYTLQGQCSHGVYGTLDGGCPASKINHSFVKDQDAFASGEVCYQLNHGVTNGIQKWYQTLGTDNYPVLDNSRGVVFYGYDGDVLKYSNTPITVGAIHRNICAATCNAVGYAMECWEDTRSRRFYADEACTTELNAAYVTTYSPVISVPEYDSSIYAWKWKMNNESVTYDGVTFINALEKVYPENSSYSSSEYVWFKVKDATAKNVKLKWHLNKNTFNGELYYKINDGDEIKIDIPENMWVQNLPNLKQDDKVTVYFKITSMWNITLNSPLIWTMSLEYCPGHSIEHVEAKAATCTVKGNKEYWHCPDCSTYFTNEACTASTTDYIIAALGHDFTYIPYKTSTCTSEGDVEHWHCNRCEKDFNVGEQMASDDHVITGNLTIPCKESDAIVVGMDEGKVYDDCHTFTPPTEGEGEVLIATVTFDKETVKINVNKGEETVYSLNETKPLETFFAHTFKLTANQDPNNPTDYYSTFFTSEGAYKLPKDVNAKAYIGSVEKKDERTKVLKLDAVSLIHKSEAVVLKANKSSITLMPSSIRQKASADNQLLGVDRSTILGEDDYALSYGQNGVGFYLWDGKTIGDNKAYLHLDEMEAKGVTFEFNDTPSGIENISSGLLQGDGVNLQGIHVGKNYKGIVIVRGKKYLKK